MTFDWSLHYCLTLSSKLKPSSSLFIPLQKWHYWIIRFRSPTYLLFIQIFSAAIQLAIISALTKGCYKHVWCTHFSISLMRYYVDSCLYIDSIIASPSQLIYWMVNRFITLLFYQAALPIYVIVGVGRKRGHTYK